MAIRTRFFGCTNLDLWENVYQKYIFNPVHIIIPKFVIKIFII